MASWGATARPTPIPTPNVTAKHLIDDEDVDEVDVEECGGIGGEFGFNGRGKDDAIAVKYQQDITAKSSKLLTLK